MRRTKVLRSIFPRITMREGDKKTAWDAGTNGKNNPWRIWFFSDIDNRAGVAAQELYEWRARNLWGLGAAAVVLAVLGICAWFAGPFHWVFAALPLMLAFLVVPELSLIKRWIELRSHEVEVQVAATYYGKDANAYRLHEIGGPGRGGMLTYSHLEKMTPEEIEVAMKSYTVPALRWAQRNEAFIRKVYVAKF